MSLPVNHYCEDYTMNISIGGSQLELLAQCDADHSMQRCDLDVCSGFMAILSTSDTRRLFDPAFVFADGKRHACSNQRFTAIFLLICMPNEDAHFYVKIVIYVFG